MKKAESMPLNLVIVAIILLVVLVIVLVFFTNKIGISSKEIDSCAYKGGECKSSCPEGYATIMGKCDIGTCCLKVLA